MAIEIKCRGSIRSLTFLLDGKDLVGGGKDSEILRVQANNGNEVPLVRDRPMITPGRQCVLSLAVSRDVVVGGLESGCVTVWDTETHAKVAKINTHSAKGVHAVDVSPKTGDIATESDDRAVSVWSLATGERALGPWEHDGSIVGVRYSPSGARIATASVSRDSMRIYDGRDGRLLISDIPIRVGLSLNQSFVWAPAISENGREELVVLSGDGQVRYIDATTGRTNAKWAIHSNDKPRCIAIANSGKFIATSANSSISFWDTTTYQRVGDILWHSNVVRTMAISPNGDHLASGGDDQMMTIRDLRGILPESCFTKMAREKIVEMNGRGCVCSVAFLSDGVHMVSGGLEGKIRIWRMKDGREVGPAIDAGSSIFNLVVSRNGKWVVCWTERGPVIVWDLKNRKKVRELMSPPKLIMAVDVSPNATRIVMGSKDFIITVWSVVSGEQLLAVNPLKQKDKLVAVKFSPNGNLIAAAMWSQGTVRVYNSDDGHLLFDVPCNVALGMNQTLVWSTDSEQFYVLTKNGSIRCIDVATKATYSEWAIHGSDRPSCIALSSNRMFIAASANSAVSFWDTSSLKQIGDIIYYDDVVRSVSISSDNGRLLSGGDDKKITLQSLKGILPNSYFTEEDPREPEIRHLKRKIIELEKTNESLLALVHTHEQKHQIELLYATGSTKEAVESFRMLTDSASNRGGVETDQFIRNWITEFAERSASDLEGIGDVASSAKRPSEAIAAYAAALSISSSGSLLEKWVNEMLVHSSVEEMLHATTKFKCWKVTIQQAICVALLGAGRTTEALNVSKAMESELGEASDDFSNRRQWVQYFMQQCVKKIEMRGDAAMDSGRYEEALEHYKTTLLHNPTDVIEVLVKRSKVLSLMEMWEEALGDANKVIKLDPSCHQGHERRHAALHGRGRYKEAAESFSKMLVAIERSPDVQISQLYRQYIGTRGVIRNIIWQTIRDTPRVLINTTTGRLLDKTQQALAFEELPIFSELVSSTTSQLDLESIREAVKHFYRYVMFSHKWEKNEPLFETLKNISIYEIKSSPENSKLQMFCSIVLNLGFQWAWSDTCCIDKSTHAVLQESLVAMFRWYHEASVTIIYLLGVLSWSAKPGDLRGSIWNMRAWTYQEYIASKVVRFYTEDWKPYLGLDMFNHRESPIIISEMEQATGVSVQELVALRPGLDMVRQKLYLASTRQTTLVEDIAYSLFGIFNAFPGVMYGEGYRAVGRLLEHILTGSGDVTILAWTGRSGHYNTCLPFDLTVYRELSAPHVPPPIHISEMTGLVDALQASLPDPSLAEKLYEKLQGLPLPLLSSSRLKLPGVCFTVKELVPMSGPDSESEIHMYRAKAAWLADHVEIRTSDDLSGLQNLVFIHPWIRPLLDQEFSHPADSSDAGPATTVFDASIEVGMRERALQFLAYLMRPFGALLLAPQSRVEYKRVAADSLIIVRIGKETPLTNLMESVCTIDVH